MNTLGSDHFIIDKNPTKIVDASMTLWMLIIKVRR